MITELVGKLLCLFGFHFRGPEFTFTLESQTIRSGPVEVEFVGRDFHFYQCMRCDRHIQYYKD